MPLQAVASKRLYQQVADQIASLIREGHWSAGDRLPSERDMSQQLGVSRPTVREAILALEIAGLVEVRTGAGIYVLDESQGRGVTIVEDSGPSPSNLMHARILIESEIAATASQTISDEQLQELEEAVNKMEDDVAHERQSVSNEDDGDLLFHSRLASATGNMVLVSIVDQLWEGMRRPLFKTICERVKLPTNALRAAADHRVILERLRARDSEGSRNAMRLHLEQVNAMLFENGEDARTDEGKPHG